MYAQPDYPAALASLQVMDSDQLKEILNNEDKFEDFMRELPQVKALLNEKNLLMASNKSLAQYNMSQEPVLREGKQRLAEKHSEATSLSSGLRSLQSELQTKSGQVGPETLLALLQAAMQEVEDEGENLMESFLQGGDRNVEQFMEEYLEKRKLAHLRRIKVEKMKELIQQQRQEGSSSTPSRQAPPPPLPYPSYSQPGGNLPYPNPNFSNMPMPPNYR